MEYKQKRIQEKLRAGVKDEYFLQQDKVQNPEWKKQKMNKLHQKTIQEKIYVTDLEDDYVKKMKNNVDSSFNNDLSSFKNPSEEIGPASPTGIQI